MRADERLSLCGGERLAYPLPMEIRTATASDLGTILDIYNEAVLNTTATYDYEPRTAKAQMDWFVEHQVNGLPVFVAVGGDGRIVGWSSIGPYRPRPGYRFTVEDSIYVAAPERGKGIGKLLMPPLIDAANRLNRRAILGVIDSESQASLRLHAQFGFQEAGRLTQVGFKFGRWLDVVIMELLLDQPTQG